MRAHDLDVRAVGWTAAVIAATVIVVISAVLLMLRHSHLPPGGDRLGPHPRPGIDDVTLQSAPQPDLARYREEKRKLLESAAWVDRSAGIARIPIADAMDIVSGAQR